MDQERVLEKLLYLQIKEGINYFYEYNSISFYIRSATIVCKEDTHFMSLSKEGFDKVFSVYKMKMFED